MTPSSLDIDIWLWRAKGSAEQRHLPAGRQERTWTEIDLAMSSVKPINCPVANCSLMRIAH